MDAELGFCLGGESGGNLYGGERTAAGASGGILGLSTCANPWGGW